MGDYTREQVIDEINYMRQTGEYPSSWSDTTIMILEVEGTERFVDTLCSPAYWGEDYKQEIYTSPVNPDTGYPWWSDESPNG